MKVLLLNPPYRSNFIRSARSTWPSISGSNWYPIFLAYATGWLKKHGHEAKLVDALVAGLSPQEVLDLAKEFQPELLALYISDQSLKSDLLIGQKIKQLTSCQLVLVGPWCSANPNKILASSKSVDAVVPAEFDDVLLDLANHKPRRQIKGLVYRQNGKTVVTGSRNFLTPRQLDQFPFVTQIYQKHLSIKKYYQASLLHPFVDLFTARGCPWGKCTFCLWPNTIHKNAPPYRTRSLKSVIEELKFVRSELPFVREVFIQDDTLPAVRTRQLSELILEERLKITWSCYARANVDLQTLKLMKKAGCRFLHVGYESADETILKNICKGTTPEEMKRFTENTKKVGLRVHGDFIFGLPGETEETIKKTIAWAKALGIEGYQFFLPQPHPGTPFFSWLKDKGFLNKDGQVSYPHLNHKKLNFWRFQAMKEIYISPNYLFGILKNTRSLADWKRLVRIGLFFLPSLIKKR